MKEGEGGLLTWFSLIFKRVYSDVTAFHRRADLYNECSLLRFGELQCLGVIERSNTIKLPSDAGEMMGLVAGGPAPSHHRAITRPALGQLQPNFACLLSISYYSAQFF